MKDILIILGKPLCPVCVLANNILSKLESKYSILRVNILSLFTKDTVTNTLGMKTYDLINSITEFFGTEYVMVLKMRQETGAIAFVPIKQYLVVGQINMSAIDYDQLERDVETAPFGEWPPKQKSQVASRVNTT